MVGPKKSSHAITEEYAKADPVYVAKTAVCWLHLYVVIIADWLLQRNCRRLTATTDLYSAMATVAGGVRISIHIFACTFSSRLVCRSTWHHWFSLM